MKHPQLNNFDSRVNRKIDVVNYYRGCTMWPRHKIINT